MKRKVITRKTTNIGSLNRLFKIKNTRYLWVFTKRSVALLFVPQVIGIVLLIVICVGLVVYVIRESCQQEVEMQDADVAELTVLRMSSLRTRTS